MVRSFAFDLKLPFNFDLELDEEGFYRKVVQELISLTGEDDYVGRLLTDYVKQRSQDDGAWDPEQLIQNFAKLLYREEATLYINQLKQLGTDELARIREGIRKTLKSFSEKVKPIAQHALGLIKQQGLGDSDFHHGKTGPQSLFHKISRDQLLLKDTRLKYLQDAILEGKWFSKTSPSGPAMVVLGKNLSKLVKTAERGRSTVITRNGKKVARIDPVGSDKKASLPDLAEFRASLKVKGKKLSGTVVDQREKERY